LGVPSLAACGFTIPLRPSLEGTRWQVRSINGETLPTTSAYQVEFRGGRFAGKFGCNSFSGPYRLGQESIFVGPVAATEMACAGDAMAHEAAGFAALSRPLRIFWTDLGARLVLTSSAGSLDLSRIK
jgi:heat shock protein HslJ